MFSLPRALKLNPFSAPSDPKLTFRSEHLPRLYTSLIPQSEHRYWALYWTIPETAYDVLNLVTSNDITRGLATYPENIVNLVIATCDRLQSIFADPTFPQQVDAKTGFTSLLPSFAAPKAIGHSGISPEHDLNRELLNCLRLLSRLIPHIFAHEDTSLEDDVFWKALAPDSSGNGLSAPSQFVIQDDEEADTSMQSAAPASPISSKSKSNTSNAPTYRGERLLHATIDLLFVPGFTLPSSIGAKRVSYQIWENGIGATASLPSNRETDSKRVEVLRFLLVLLSKTLYIPTSAYTPLHNHSAYESSFSGMTQSLSSPVNRWHAYMTGNAASSSARSRKVRLTILCSLLNTSLKSGAMHAASSSGIVGAVGGAVGEGYEKLVSGGKRKEDAPRVALAKLCVQVLNALLVAPSSEASEVDLRDDSRQDGIVSPVRQTPSASQRKDYFSPAPGEYAERGVNNVFRSYISKIHRTSDLSFIAENISTILMQPLGSSLLSLPLNVAGLATLPSPAMATDFLILLWRIVDCNPKFVAHLLERPQNVHLMLSVLLFFCLEFKEDAAQLGLVKLSAFLLQTLSAERAFGASLNVALSSDIPLPSRYAVAGTAADFLIQQIYHLIFASKGALNAIYPAFILTLTNVSPYIKNPSIRSATQLVQLFMAMSAPNFLLSDEANPRLTFYLLEAFNNIIHYQLSDCPNLVYAIVRSHARFEELANFTLAEGVAVIRATRRRRQGVGQSGSGKTSRRTSLASEYSLETTRMVSDPNEDPSMRGVDAEKMSLQNQQQRPDLPETTQRVPSQPTSPVLEYPPRMATMSEKSRGKLPQRSASQLTLYGNHHAGIDDTDGEGPFTAINGFQPTENWVASWREGLPIDSILIMISEFLPKVSSLSALSSNTAVIEYLRSANLVGLLPPAPSIRSRRFVHSTHSAIWLTSLAWGSIYVHSLEAFWVWRESSVRLFTVKTTAVGVQAAVHNIVGQGLGMLNLGGSGNGVLSPIAQRRHDMSRRSTSSSVV